MRVRTLRSANMPFVTLFALALAASPALAQGAGGPGGGVPGQGGLSPDTPTIAPTPPGVNGGGGPKTALPPRDTPRAKQPGRQAAAPDLDWPCVQPKVTSLSYGQMWSGPPLEDAMKTWRDDERLVELVAELAARRTPIEDAKAKIDSFVKEAGDRSDARLIALFAGVFEEINAQRSRILTGIERYSRKQRDLSERIKAASLKMASEQGDMASQNTPEAMQRQQALDWDTRIYEERAQSLTYVCESPVILEQRAFDLGRAIQARLTQNGQ